jgi:hypothetical protein
MKCHWVESSHDPRPGPSRPAQACMSACNGVARARGGAASMRCGDDLTGAREAAGKSTAGPHRRGRAHRCRRRRAGSTAVQRRPTRDDGGEGQRDRDDGNAVAQRTHWCVGRGRRRRRRGQRRGALRHAGDSARHEASGRAIGAWTQEMVRSGRRRMRRSGRRRGQEAAAVGTDARGPDSALRCGAWQPRGDDVLTGRSSVGSGG